MDGFVNNIDEFKAELRALLDKYNADITCNVNGDTHGLTYEMVVTLGRDTYVLARDSYIEANDLK